MVKITYSYQTCWTEGKKSEFSDNDLSITIQLSLQSMHLTKRETVKSFSEWRRKAQNYLPSVLLVLVLGLSCSWRILIRSCVYFNLHFPPLLASVLRKQHILYKYNFVSCDSLPEILLNILLTALFLKLNVLESIVSIELLVSYRHPRRNLESIPVCENTVARIHTNTNTHTYTFHQWEF